MRKSASAGRVLISLLVFFAPMEVSLVRAQSIQGSISGTVLDASGAVLPGVTVSVTSEQTQFTRTTVSNDAGLYSIPNLEPGLYTIKASAAAFMTNVDHNVRLMNRQTLTLDIHMKVGEITQTVTVEARTPVIRTENAALEMSYDQKFYDVIPTTSGHGYGQGATEALRKLPGAYYTRLFGSEGSAAMVNGSRSTETVVTVQGIKQTSYGGYDVPTSAIQEIRVERFNPPAEFATPGNMETSIRGATSQYHGEVIYDLRNTLLNSGSFYSPRPAAGIPGYALATNFGGPLYIPKIYPKDKTFIFFDYERNKASSFSTPQFFNMPTVPMRNGDFSTLTIGGKPVTVIDPLNGQPFPGQRIPSGRFNPVAQNILNFYPAPNSGDPNVPVRNLIADTSQSGAIWLLAFRVDHNLTSKQTLSFADGTGRLPQTQDLARGGTGSIPGLVSSVSETNTDIPSLAWTYAMRSNAVNEFRVGLLRIFNNGSAGPMKLTGRGVDWLRQLGIQGINPGVDAFAMPAINITEVQGIQGRNQTRTAKNYLTIMDNMSVQKGRHGIKFGMNVHNYQQNTLNVDASAYGNLNFTGRFTGVGFADFLLGVPETTSVFSPRPEIGARFRDVGFYFQDKWAITPYVTLSYGLREDFWVVPHDNRNLWFNFDPKTGGLVVPNDEALRFVNSAWPQNIPLATAAQAGYPARLRHISYVNLAPRLALALRPFRNDKTAVRIGYGIYHDPLTFDSFLPFAGGPFAVSQTFLNSFDPVTNQYLFALPRPVPANVGPQTAGLGSIAITALNPNADRVPYVQQWSLTIDQEILPDTRASVSYIGSKATQLMYQRNVNVPLPSTIPFTLSRRPYPLFNQINIADNGGNQTYQSLEVMIHRRFSGGILFDGGYIWAAAINDTDDSGSDLGPVTPQPFCRSCNKGRQLDVVAHSFKANFVWQVPLGRGRHFLSNAHPVLDAIIGGWETSNSIEFRTGEFLTPTFTGRDISNTGITSGFPDRVCDGNISGPKNFRNKVGDLNCFVIPPAGIGRFGNSARGIIVGPNNKFWDGGIYKQFSIAERVKVRLGAVTQTAFNWISFGFHNMNITSPTGFEATGAAKGRPAGRNAEITAKLSF